MSDPIKSYKLSPQLRAELGTRRFQKPRFDFRFSIPKIGLSKIPWRATILTVVVFVGVSSIYFGVKKGYEYTAMKSEQARQEQLAQYQSHLAQVKTEVETKATDAVTAVALSQQYLKAGDGERAEAAAIIATGKDPVWRDTYINLGQVYLATNKFTEAKQALESALKIDPIYGETHYLLSLAYQELNKADLAKAEFAKAKKFGFEGELGG